MHLQTHLSDEAVVAFADGVLRGRAHDRAQAHVAACAECAQAVRAQREAAAVLRASADPAPQHELLQRLRELPQNTAIDPEIPAAASRDGSPLMSVFGQHAALTGQPPSAGHTAGHSAGHTVGRFPHLPHVPGFSGFSRLSRHLFGKPGR